MNSCNSLSTRYVSILIGRALGKSRTFWLLFTSWNLPVCTLGWTESTITQKKKTSFLIDTYYQESKTFNFVFFLSLYLIYHTATFLISVLNYMIIYLQSQLERRIIFSNANGFSVFWWWCREFYKLIWMTTRASYLMRLAMCNHLKFT